MTAGLRPAEQSRVRSASSQRRGGTVHPRRESPSAGHRHLPSAAGSLPHPRPSFPPPLPPRGRSCASRSRPCGERPTPFVWGSGLGEPAGSELQRRAGASRRWPRPARGRGKAAVPARPAPSRLSRARRAGRGRGAAPEQSKLRGAAPALREARGEAAPEGAGAARCLPGFP